MPTAPVRQLHEIVGAHQPDEPDQRKPQSQQPQRVDGVTSAESLFDIGGDDASAVADCHCAGETLPERRHATHRFQRIARGHQQPDLVQPQPPPGHAGEVQVAGMRGIEGATEQADAGLPSVTEFRDQGRTWPLPVTR